MLIVEIKGKDVWRGREKSINEAMALGVAGIGLDKILLKRALDKHETNVAMVVIEDFHSVYFSTIEAFFNEHLSKSRTNYRSRGIRVLPMSHFQAKYLGPTLHSKKSRATA